MPGLPSVVRRTTSFRLAACAALLVCAGVARAEPVAPATALRELSTDRPDTTESPFTVDRGYFQIELSFAEWTRTSADGARTTTLDAVPFNVRYGLDAATEVDLVVGPYARERRRVPGAATRTASGFGDVTVRLKRNLWGNDGAGTAFALLPYVTFPTSGSRGTGHVEGGVILPFALPLAAGWGLSTMAALDLPRNEDNDGYAADVVHSASLGHDFGGGVGAYVELAGFWSPDGDRPYRATFDAGVTLARGANAQLDAGFRLGLTRATDDRAVFAGVSVRF